jgi:hypothetical protein
MDIVCHPFYSCIWPFQVCSTLPGWHSWRVNISFFFTSTTISNPQDMNYCSATFAVVVSIMIHPPLLARIVFISVLVPLSTLATVLPISRMRQPFLRFITSSTGAFGAILCMALLSRENKFIAWMEVWERLYYSDGENWGTSGEKGLTAAWSFLLIAGIAMDWILCWRYGENPDEACSSITSAAAYS